MVSNRGQRGAVSPLLVAVVGSTLLVMALLVTWAAVMRFQGEATSAEGTRLLHAIADRLRSTEGPPSDEVLEGALVALSGQGLRGLALVSPEGHVLAKAGATEEALLELPTPGQTVVRGRLGHFLAPPPGEPERNSHRPSLLVVFEPTSAAKAATAATVALGIGLAAAFVFMGVAVGYSRAVRLQEESARRLLSIEHLANLGEMSAVVAHELRSPLTALKGYAQLLSEQAKDNDSIRRRADRVVAEALRLESLTRSLLDFVRSGNIQRAPSSPRALAEQTLSEFDTRRVRLSVDGAPPSFSLDAVRMRQVLVNLVQNALDVAPQDTSVDLEVRAEGSTLLVLVRDRGPGIPIEVLPKLFKPFATFKAKGTGLGLAVSRRIVELHGGTIVARNREGGGAEFEVRLPGQGPA